MARMLPPQASENTKSPAELRLFRKIRDELSDEWFALHSLGLTSHRAKPWAEIDFVLIGPGGIYCLEVKGGRVARVDGEWMFTNRHGQTTRKHEGPFAQVGSASAALYRDLLGHVPALARSAAGYGVVVPDIAFDVEGPDIEPAIVYDERDVSVSFERYVARLRKYWHERLEADGRRQLRPLSPHDRTAIVEHLRGDFDLRPSLRAQVGAVNEELWQLTRAQYTILDALVENRRVIIKGAAGTGKTMLAVEEARRHADAGRHVLLCCYNRALGRFLAEVVSDGSHIEARTIHSLMASLVEHGDLSGRLPAASENDLFTVFYPELALEVLLDHGPIYDVLVVDEAQDVLSSAYVDVLDAALIGGIGDGHWRAFIDPLQNIFDGSDPSVLAGIMERAPAQYRLSVNCRNTAAIATDTAILAGLDRSEVLKADGPDVEHEWYRDPAHQRRLVGNRLNRLLSDGLPLSDIVILGRRRLREKHTGARPLILRPTRRVRRSRAAMRPLFDCSRIQGTRSRRRAAH